MSRMSWRAAPGAMAVRTTCAVAAAAAVFAVAGCGTRPSVAAYVGPDDVSTSSLSSTVDHGLQSPTVSQVWAQKPADYRRQVLDGKIYHLIVSRAAAKAGVSVSDAQVAELSQEIVRQDKSGYENFLGRQGVPPDQGQAFLKDVMLTSQVAIRKHLASVPRRYRVGIIEVPDSASATAVTRRLRQDPGSYAAEARRYPGSNTKVKPIELADSDLQQLLGRDVSSVHSGQTLTVQPPQAPGQTFVVHIFGVERPALASLPGIDRTNIMLAMYQSARPQIIKNSGEHVRINPRFGTWDTHKGAVAQADAPAVRTLTQAGSDQ